MGNDSTAAQHKSQNIKALGQSRSQISHSTQERTTTTMDTNRASSSSLAPQPAPNDINEKNPDPIPETHPRNAQPFETFCSLESDYDITDIQTRAIELTIQGHTDTRIAELLRITRKTVSKWKTHNSNYQQALNAARIQAHAGIIDRYRNLLLRASDILAQVLEDHNEDKRIRAAFALLNMAGNFRPPQPLQPDPKPQDHFPPPILPQKAG
jgi:DNA-binding CsgD family transcriptional regulator